MSDRYHRTRQGWNVIYGPERGVGHADGPTTPKAIRFEVGSQGKPVFRKPVPNEVAADIERWIKDGMP